MRKTDWFLTTEWQVVLQAGNGDGGGSGPALQRLCSTYWYPLYTYIRQKGFSPDDAEDLTQSFFAALLENDSLAQVDPSKGKFRSFLLAAANHFLANERVWRGRQKRGGNHTMVSIDAADAEKRYALELVHHDTPEREFLRRWAVTLLSRALTRLEEAQDTNAKDELFQRLKGMLSGEKTDARYCDIARDLGMTEAAVKKAAQRLRSRYRELVRTEIAATVASPAEVDEEVRFLFAVLGSDVVP